MVYSRVSGLDIFHFGKRRQDRGWRLLWLIVGRQLLQRRQEMGDPDLRVQPLSGFHPDYAGVLYLAIAKNGPPLSRTPASRAITTCGSCSSLTVGQQDWRPMKWELETPTRQQTCRVLRRTLCVDWIDRTGDRTGAAKKKQAEIGRDRYRSVYRYRSV